MPPSPAPFRSAWEDLPVELFEQTLTFLDDSSLLALAKVNRLFNRTALQKLFGKAMTDDLLRNSRFSNVPIHGKVRTNAVKGLRLALWLPKLEHLHHRPSKESFLEDLSNLITVVAGLPHLRSLHLHLEKVQDRNYQAIDPAILMISELCDIAIERGCQSLKLAQFHGPYEYSQSAPSVDCSAMPHNLQSLQICGACLAPLESYTHDLLSIHAGTIRHLHFDRSTNFVRMFPTWKSILGSLYFPNLQTFQFDHPVLTQVRRSSIIDFLSRHSTITKLRLYCGLYRSSDPFQALEPPRLPSLSTIESESRFIAWLFQHPNVCPVIKKVVISQGEANARFLDEALQAVIGLTAGEPPENVVLQIKLYSRVWTAWMMRHIEDEERVLSGSQLEKLSFQVNSTAVDMDAEAMDCFAQWVALFPALQRLEILRPSSDDGVEQEVASKEEELRHAVSQRCPGLKSFRFLPSNDNDFEMDLYDR